MVGKYICIGPRNYQFQCILFVKGNMYSVAQKRVCIVLPSHFKTDIVENLVLPICLLGHRSVWMQRMSFTLSESRNQRELRLVDKENKGSSLSKQLSSTDAAERLIWLKMEKDGIIQVGSKENDWFGAYYRNKLNGSGSWKKRITWSILKRMGNFSLWNNGILADLKIDKRKSSCRQTTPTHFPEPFWHQGENG